MNESFLPTLKNWGIFLVGACLTIFSYSREAANQRSPNRIYSNGEETFPQVESIPVTIEEDQPEISSGTQ